MIKRDPPLWEGGPYTHKDLFHDPFAAFAYLTGRYETIDVVKKWQDVGGTHATICSVERGYKMATQHIDYLAEVKSLLDTI